MLTIRSDQRGYTVVTVAASSGRQTSHMLYKGDELVAVDIQHSSGIRRQWLLIGWMPRTDYLKTSWGLDGFTPSNAEELAERTRLALRTTVMA